MSQKNSKNGNGNNPLVDEFLEKREKTLKAFIFKIIDDLNATDDVFQRALENILKNQHKFRGDSQFATWAYSIAKNETFRYMRERNYKKRHVEDQEVYEIALAKHSSESSKRGSGAHYKNPEEMFMETEQKEITDDLYNNKRNRTVILQSQNYSTKEIAKMLNIPEGSVKSEAFHARKRLRKEVEERGLISLQ